MYKFKWEPNLTVIEAKTNRKLATFNSEGVFETTDEYVAKKLIQKGIKYTVKATNINPTQEKAVKLLEETVQEKEKENLLLKEQIERYKIEIASLTENKPVDLVDDNPIDEESPNNDNSVVKDTDSVDNNTPESETSTEETKPE